jgi:N-6 DNA Methylase
MNLDALLKALGYLSTKQNWVTPESADPRLIHYYRLAGRAGADVGAGASVVGSYSYQTSLDDKLTPPRPAVFVAEATNEAQARGIHKRLWNLGNCPFLIVVLPGSVRVYTGFDYSHEDPTRTLIVVDVDPLLDGALSDRLQPFRADAIDSGSIWEEQARFLGSSSRVDYRLLEDLGKLSRILQEDYGLVREVAHALIGKYIYFRYLRDRRILDDAWLGERAIRPEDVFGSDASAHGFTALAAALDRQFNGDIFPLPVNDNGHWRMNGAIRFLAGVFHGHSPGGQLALDFAVYDFSYIPVELLSSVYEQFLNDEGIGATDSVVYTPEPLADYVLAELDAMHPLRPGHKVLDPCCGSGVFLVLAYRRLIERLWSQGGRRPSAEALKHLLEESIFGVEKDLEACHITAFSLILTLLSHLELPELQANTGFQFPILVGENVYCADFFDSNCPVFQKGLQFDWVAGNPPWCSADERNDGHQLALAWIRKEARRGRDVGERRLDEAFTWRAGDTLKEDGHAGLLIMATTLVNSSSARYRRAFFRDNDVCRVTNLSNLRRLLFMSPKGKRAEAPAACVVFRASNAERQKKPILHFGPFVANQLPVRTKAGRRCVWTIMLYESDIQHIEYADAEQDVASLWKAALWGSYQDRRALRRLNNLLPISLGECVDRHNCRLEKGLELYRGRSSSREGFVPCPRLEDQLLFVERQAGRLTVARSALVPITKAQEFVRRRSGSKGLALIPAPHLVVTAEGAIYSDADFVIPSPKVGIAGEPKNAALLKAIALYLSSSVARYAHFFLSASWGIYIYTANAEDVAAIPIADLSGRQITNLEAAYDALAAKERAYSGEYLEFPGSPIDLQREIDVAVESSLRIPESIALVAREFMQVRFQLTEGKVGGTARKLPTDDALRQYADQLRLQLDDFARRSHSVAVFVGSTQIMVSVEITEEREPIAIRVSHVWDASAQRILDEVRHQHSQWAYVQRSVRIFDGPRVHIVKAPRLLDWTRTQAIHDAGDLIGEVLDRTSPHYEPITA